MKRSETSFPRAAFTLVELLIVMALLAIFMAISAPSLSRSLRQRKINDEANRFLALTEYARSEAISQGIPMVVWLNPTQQRYGVEAAAGFIGEESRARAFTTNSEVQFEVPDGAAKQGVIEVVRFQPDGAPELSAVDAIALADRFDASAYIARTQDGWGFEIVPITQ